MHSAVAVGAAAFNLARSNLLSQRQILCRYVHAIDINNTPYVVLLFSYIGGLLSIVRFYWFGSPVLQVFYHIILIPCQGSSGAAVGSFTVPSVLLAPYT